ncbi:MAG: MFS transporter [Candidatus Limnocylindria bacterium]
MFGLPANYWRLWGSSAASNLADGVFLIVLPLLAVRLTDSPLLIAGVALVGRLPWLFFVLIAGALADRLDRRRTMRNVQLFRVMAVGALVLLSLSGGLSLPVLYVAALGLGVAETFFDTAAQSILPSIVGKERLSLANGRLYGVELVMNQFVGPPLGGLLIVVSLPVALGSSVIGYAIAAVGLSLIIGNFKPVRTGPPTRLTADIGEGLRYLWTRPVLRTLAIMVGVMNLASSATQAIFVLFALGPMGLTEPEFGLLITTFAVGSLVGSFAAAALERRFGRVPLLFSCVIITAFSFAVPAITTNIFVIGGSFVISGLFVVVWNVITVSLRQRIVPDQLLGRLNSAYRLLAWGTQPIGALAGGLIGQFVGLQAVFLMAGALGLTLLITSRMLTEGALSAAEAEGEAVAAA